MRNLNYLMNKHYYGEIQDDKISVKRIKECNTELFEGEFEPTAQLPQISATHSFVLETVYPGLLIGIGNPHEVSEEFCDAEKPPEIKLGFTFDYVTGLPIIPGSTIKGVLHSAFKRYPDAIDESLLSFENEIFGDESGRGKCVFYDAYPIDVPKSKHLVGKDIITPHPSPLKNPKPISMLKVIPGVKFLFRFDLSGFSKKEGLSISDSILMLFQEILTELGIGAKTNVGFGVMKKSAISNDKFNCLKMISSIGV